MDLADYLRSLRRYARSTTAITLVVVLAGAALSLLLRPVYEVTTSLFLSVKTVTSANDLSAGSTYVENQVQSYAFVAGAPIVLQPVIDELALNVTPDELAEHLTVTVPTDTATIDLSVTDTDPEQAARIAAAIAESTLKAVSQLSPPAADGSQMVQATVIRPAAPPTSPSSPNVPLILALALLVGLLLGVGQAVLRDSMRSRISSAKDLETATGRPVVGTVVLDAKLNHRVTSAPAAPNTPAGEAYRQLRTALQFLSLDHGQRSIVVTSAAPEEGRTTTAINVASVLADAGKRVLLIDADLRTPAVADRLRIDGSSGLTTVLFGRGTLSDVVQPYGGGGLDVLPAGPIPPNPSEVLGVAAMRSLIDQASHDYDAVIIDTPPLQTATDAAVIARIVDGALMVVGSGVVRGPEVSAALDSLALLDVCVLGLVLNRVKPSDAGRSGLTHSQQEVHTTQGARAAEASDGARRAS